MATLDQQIGGNLARLRAPRMSQRALADAMSEAGWKWSHVTVGSIERGERPLRASEAIGAASILDVPVNELVDARDAAEMRQAQAAVIVALNRLQTAVSAWNGARLELAVVADTLGYELPEPVGGVHEITAVPLIGLTASAVTANAAREQWLDDFTTGYIESRGNGRWVRAYVEAEERDHGEHPAAP